MNLVLSSALLAERSEQIITIATPLPGIFFGWRVHLRKHMVRRVQYKGIGFNTFNTSE